jgi:hypothetical protein
MQQPPLAMAPLPAALQQVHQEYHHPHQSGHHQQQVRGEGRMQVGHDHHKQHQLEQNVGHHHHPHNHPPPPLQARLQPVRDGRKAVNQM